MYQLAIGVVAALAFPIVAIAFHQRRDSSRDRKAGRRRNDKIRL